MLQRRLYLDVDVEYKEKVVVDEADPWTWRRMFDLTQLQGAPRALTPPESVCRCLMQALRVL